MKDTKHETKRYQKSMARKLWRGTQFDLDYGKLAILILCIYIAVQVS